MAPTVWLRLRRAVFFVANPDPFPPPFPLFSPVNTSRPSLDGLRNMAQKSLCTSKSEIVMKVPL